MKRCSHCRGSFGLVAYQRSDVLTWYSERFCSKKCREAFLDKLARDRQRLLTWLGFLRPT
jgi:hypothetical protein